MKLLLLCTGAPSSHLVKAITDAGHTYEVHDPRDLYLLISENVNGYDRIFDGSKGNDEPVRLFAKGYDGLICRIGKDLELCLPVVRHLTHNLNIFNPSPPLGLLIAHDKLWTTQRLSADNLPVPLSVFAIRANHVEFTVKAAGGLPVVAKQLTGSQGAGVSILETPLSANTTLESFNKAGIPIKLQRFVKAHTSNGGQATDIRAIVVGNKVVSAMERSANEGDFRANLSKGGSGKSVTLTDNEQAITIQAAKAVGLSFAGVDLMREGQKTYITEVNGNPGTGIIDITGHNHFEDLVQYIGAHTQKSESSSTKQDIAIQPTLPKSENLSDPMGLAKHYWQKRNTNGV
jgi:ribosomal protein S6--L-glutamate ligase